MGVFDADQLGTMISNLYCQLRILYLFHCSK